jgi:hypothetical protein
MVIKTLPECCRLLVYTRNGILGNSKPDAAEWFVFRGLKAFAVA